MDLSQMLRTRWTMTCIPAPCFRRKVTDGSVLGLLEQFLTAGRDGWEPVPSHGAWQPARRRHPVHLIANVYLDAFDQFMKKRGHRIVRYADDILILCGSRAASENALNVATAGTSKVTFEADSQPQQDHLATRREGIHFPRG